MAEAHYPEEWSSAPTHHRIGFCQNSVLKVAAAKEAKTQNFPLYFVSNKIEYSRWDSYIDIE